MANLIDHPAWADNEVYQIDRNDTVEGAHSGAAFSGLGAANEPHQQLANRAAYLKRALDTLVGKFIVAATFNTIGGVVPFALMPVAPSYLKMPVKDTGVDFTLALQWGSAALTGTADPVVVPVTPSLPFAGVLARAFWAAAWPVVRDQTTPPFTGPFAWVPSQSSASALVFVASRTGAGTINSTAMTWMAIGTV